MDFSRVRYLWLCKMYIVTGCLFMWAAYLPAPFSDFGIFMAITLISTSLIAGMIHLTRI
jgi:uncharacterized membrane protein (UPF0136 family)